MPNNNNYIGVTMGLDVTDLESGVRIVRQRLNDLDTLWRRTASTMQDWRNTEEGVSARMDTLSQKITEQERIIRGYQARIAQLSENYDENREKIERLQMQLVREETSLNKLNNAHAHWSSRLREIQQESSKLHKINQTLTKGWTMMGQVIANFATMAIRDLLRSFREFVEYGIEFESAFTNVEKTVDGTAEELAGLNAQIRAMGQYIPQSTVEIANVAALAGQLGIATTDIAEFTRVMLMLGTATNMSAEEAADTIARFGNVIGLEIDEYSRLASSIVDLGNNFATTESEILSMSQRIAGTAVQVRFSETDVLALSTALSSLGVEAEMGGSALSRLMANMNVAVASGGDTLESFARVAGQSADEFASNFRTNAMGALQDFLAGLSDVESNGGNAITTLNELGITEVRLRDVILRLVAGQDVLNSALERAGTAWEENTALATEANRQYETTASQIQLMKNAWNEVGNSFEKAINPAIRGVVGLLTDLGNALGGNRLEGYNLKTAFDELVTAIDLYNQAQEQAKLSTDETTDAFLQQQGVVLNEALLRYAETYRINQREIENNRSQIRALEFDIERWQEQLEEVANAYGMTRQEADRAYATGQMSGQLERTYRRLTNLIQDARASISTYQGEVDKLLEGYENVLVASTQMYIDNADFMENLLMTNTQLASEVLNLGSAYERGYEIAQQFVSSDSFENNRLAELERIDEMLQTVARDTEAYWVLMGRRSAIAENTPAEVLGIQTEDTTDPHQEILDSAETTANQLRIVNELLGKDSEETAQAILSLYERTLTQLIQGGASVKEECVQQVLSIIDEIRESLAQEEVIDNPTWLEWFIGKTTPEGFDELITYLRDNIQPILDLFQNMANQIGSVISNIYQTQLNQIDSMLEELKDSYEDYLEELEGQTNRRQALINAQYESGSITEDEYYANSTEAQQQAILKQTQAQKNYESEYEDLMERRDEIARQQFEAEKANSIANVWINLAGAIMQTYAQSGWLLGSIFAGLLTAVASTQTAAIASQSYTSAFAKGGVVDRPTVGLVGEAGREVIMPLENNLGWIKELAGQLSFMLMRPNGDSYTSYVTPSDTYYNNSSNITNNYNQTINSPSALSRKEIYRDTRNLLRMMRRA